MRSLSQLHSSTDLWSVSVVFHSKVYQFDLDSLSLVLFLIFSKQSVRKMSFPIIYYPTLFWSIIIRDHASRHTYDEQKKKYSAVEIYIKPTKHSPNWNQDALHRITMKNNVKLSWIERLDARAWLSREKKNKIRKTGLDRNLSQLLGHAQANYR